jgi:hypothetical protein
MEREDREGEGEATAAEAFEALRREVALMRLGVEALAGERRAQPDYTETLGQLAADMATSSAAMGRLAERGALSLTPEDVAREIRTAQGHARREATEVMQDAVRHLSGAARELGRWVEQTHRRSAESQVAAGWDCGGDHWTGGRWRSVRLF